MSSDLKNTIIVDIGKTHSKVSLWSRDGHCLDKQVRANATGPAEPSAVLDTAGIADWLVRITHNQRNWGFGMCFMFLRNVKGYEWNHKRVYRIYRLLELNLRIKQALDPDGILNPGAVL